MVDLLGSDDPGWQDMARVRSGSTPATPSAATTKPRAAKPRAERRRLGYKDQRELDALPERIADLEAEIAEQEALLADPELYERDRASFDRGTDGLATLRTALADAEERWIELAERDEALKRGAGG